MILGAIIAGGRSSRFGSDKATALLDGAPLIAHAVLALRPWVAETVVCGRAWDGLSMLDDWPAPDLGPLGGIAAALRHADAHRYDSVLTIGCDMPRVPSALLAELVARPAAYAADAPILGHWPVVARGELERRLTGGEERSIRGWALAVGAAALAWPERLANVNTPAELARL